MWGLETALKGLKHIFGSRYYKVVEAYDITKQKIYMGLHFDYKKTKVTLCAVATDKDRVIKNFNEISEEELIQKVGGYSPDHTH